MINFKRLELQGFKSFAGKTVIDFKNSFTGIVGPNGCGKSNVADAVRWVLGEMSAKALRGAKMQDVIFNGTEKRPSMSYCEVSLVFDNSNHVFKTDREEVVVTRKLWSPASCTVPVPASIILTTTSAVCAIFWT